MTVSFLTANYAKQSCPEPVERKKTQRLVGIGSGLSEQLGSIRPIIEVKSRIVKLVDIPNLSAKQLSCGSTGERHSHVLFQDFEPTSQLKREVSEETMGNNTTYGTFEELVNSADSELQSICIALREVISTLHQDFVEVVWLNQGIASYGVGPKKMSEHYVYIALYKNHVNLGFYHGTALSDPADLLEGTGKRLRHVKTTSAAEAMDPQIKKLIAEAIEERKDALA